MCVDVGMRARLVNLIGKAGAVAPLPSGWQCNSRKPLARIDQHAQRIVTAAGIG